MIPSLPEAISATHVEYLSLTPVHLKPVNNISCFRDKENRRYDADQRSQRTVTRDELMKMRTLRAMQEFIPTMILSAVPRSITVSLLRGNDLHYAPHVNVPAAESFENS